MLPAPVNAPARIYDFAAYRMARVAQRRRDSGITRRFLWGNPVTGAMTAVKFATASQIELNFSVLVR